MYFSGIAGASGIAGIPTGSLGAGQSSALVQGSATVGWIKGGRRGRFSLAWSPQYLRGLQGVNFQSINQSLGLTGTRSIGTHWSLDVAASGVLSDFSQLQLAQGRFAGIAGVQASFDELAAAILSGRVSNPGLIDAIRTPATLASPESAFLYGGRMFSASTAMSLSYNRSTRSSLRWSAVASRTQFTTAASQGADRPSDTRAALLPGTSAASANVSWTYSLSPRSSLTVEGGGTRVRSVLQDSYTARTGVSIGRTLTRRWFVQGSGGAGVIRPLRETLAPVRGLQAEFGGSLGYKRWSHTFLGSFQRAVSDTYGIGANSTQTASAGWNWSHPGGSMQVSATFGFSQLFSPMLVDARSWMTNGTVSRAFGRTLALQVACSYSQFPRALLIAAPSLSQTAVVTSLVWSPGGTFLH
jgi:hypothetical protein